MTINLSQHQFNLQQTLKQVINPKTDTNWAIFGYDGNSNTLLVIETGADGIEELSQSFNPGQVQYGLTTVDCPATNMPKQGEGVPTTRLGTTATHIHEVKKFFKPHISHYARHDEDVEPDVLLAHVNKVTASMQVSAVQSSHLPRSEPVGSVWEKVNAGKAIDTKAREEFWEQTEREEKARQQAEAKRVKELESRAKEEQTQLQKEIHSKLQVNGNNSNDQSSEGTNGHHKMVTSDLMRQQRLEEVRSLTAKTGSSSISPSSNISSPINSSSGNGTSNGGGGVGGSSSSHKVSVGKLWEQRQREAQGSENSPSANIPSSPTKPSSVKKWPPVGEQKPSSPAVPIVNAASEHTPSPPPPPPAPVSKAPSSTPPSHDPTPPPPITFSTSSSQATPNPPSLPPPAAPPVIQPPAPSLPLPSPPSLPSAAVLPPSLPSPSNNQTKNTNTTTPTKSSAAPPSFASTIPQRPPMDSDEEEENNDDEWEEDNAPISIPPPSTTNLTAAPSETPVDNNVINCSITTMQQEPEANFTPEPPTSMPPQHPPTAHSPEFGCSAVALWDYQASDDTEISFDPGETITYIDKVDPGWWRGTCRGVTGLFPANFVEIFDE